MSPHGSSFHARLPASAWPSLLPRLGVRMLTDQPRLSCLAPASSDQCQGPYKTAAELAAGPFWPMSDELSVVLRYLSPRDVLQLRASSKFFEGALVDGR